MLRLLGAGLLALVLPASALASAIVESLRGSAQVGSATVRQGERIFVGSTLSTGPQARARLRFDDGMEIALEENSRLRLVDFRRSQGGANNRVVLDLLAGAARVTTGEIARSNPAQFFLRTPQASFGIVGPADFSIVLSDGAYVSVSRGSVIAANRAATISVVPGPAAFIASAGATAEHRTVPARVAATLAALGVGVAAAPAAPPRAAAEPRAEPAAPAAAPSPAEPARVPAPAAPRPPAAPRLENFLFAGASVGRSDIDEAMTRGLITSGEVKSESTGFKVFGGYQFHPNLGVEAAFVDLGEAKYEGSFNGAPVTGGKLKVNGLNFAALGRVPLGQRFALFGKVGVFVWEAQASDTTAGVPFSTKTDGADASFGIGASFDITRNIALRAEGEMFGVADEKATLLSVGFAFSF
jgi:OOP family OmpA-OmpF porin